MFTYRSTRRWPRLALVLALLAAASPVTARSAPPSTALSPAAPAQLPAGWHTLTGLLPAHAEPFFPQISPDSHYLVFGADIEWDGRYELYSVPLTGTAPLKLSPPITSGGMIHYFYITPDSQYVIYTAGLEDASRPDLYRVPIAGGESVKLNVAALAGRDVREFKIDPDNARVVYRAEQLVPGQFELFSVPILGGQVTRLNPTLVAGGDVGRFDFDPILNRVVYLADQSVDGFTELYGVPIDGSAAAIPLNPANAHVDAFQVNPTLQVVVFSAKTSGAHGWQLYMNATTGGLLTPLNFTFDSDDSVIGFRISPNGARVIYNVASGSPEPSNGSLYSVLIGGGPSTPLATAAPGKGVYRYQFYPTPDSQRVLFRYQPGAGQGVLQSTALDGSDTDTLFFEAEGEYISNLHLSPNSKLVEFHTSPTYTAYSLPTDGSPGSPLGPGVGAGFLPDSTHLLMYSQAPSGYYDLLSLPVAGGDPLNLSRSASYASLGEVHISPDGRWIVYALFHAGSGRSELRASDGTAAPWVIYLPQVSR